MQGRRRKKWARNFISNNRKIKKSLLTTLKKEKYCWQCKKEFRNYKEVAIHHIIPISLDGKNTSNNLRAVHKGHCHDEADKESFKKYGEEQNEQGIL